MRKYLISILGGLAAVTLIASLYGVFVILPIVPKEFTGFSQKIFYWHMPAAIVSFVAFLVTLVASVMFLIKKDFKYDVLAYCSAEIGLVFGVVLMIFGIVWDKLAWGVWWTWDVRLTTYLILLLLFGAYFFLRSVVSDRMKQATYAAVFGIVAGLDVPISFLSTRLVKNVLHPVIFSRESWGLDLSQTVVLLLGFVGMGALYAAMLMIKMRLEHATEELHDLKDELERGRET